MLRGTSKTYKNTKSCERRELTSRMGVILPNTYRRGASLENEYKVNENGQRASSLGRMYQLIGIYDYRGVVHCCNYF